MIRRIVILLLLAFCFVLPSQAQRQMDVLSRGLVGVKTDNGVFLSWRRLGEEYYDVTYNVYRDGTKLNATPLSATNYTDASGTASNSYTVSAVVRGTEQAACSAVQPWAGYKWSTWSGYFDIPLAKVYDYNGTDVTAYYIANDAEVADLDGDGEMEIIIKRISTQDADNLYVSRTDGAYDRFEAYKLDGTLLWWIDAGPNMVSGGSHEFNLIAYDWDGDGKAEVLLRGADGMIVHGQTGEVRTDYPQVIGDQTVDTRGSINHTANMTYTNTGAEYLIYMDGDRGIIYDAVKDMDYPLSRESASAWGDSYGHRSSKYFFGAPFLDGRTPSIFLARGIYTRHKMAAYDVDPSTHSLTQRWYWECNDSSSPWYGNGNHNYCIADVDMDGRDEIVYGSMVIDDNGKGLSTTDLGHGDALHCSDFDPYRHGLEIFACNEDNPASNYRDATTSSIYHRLESTSDDGRALCGNFSDDYPGATGRTTQTGMVSCVKDTVISELGDLIAWSDLNFRIYWDGDLLSEVFNSPGTEREAKIEKPGTGRIFTSSGCKMNNYSKNNPCFLGDIIGDWREEFIARVDEGHEFIRIYTSATPTDYSLYTLWHDHQYRQAMVWQMHGYNQPPHLSYFLGEQEGITVAPPPLTTNGRTEISSGTTIGSTYDDQHLLLCEYANTTLTVEDGAAPYILTLNVPTWVQGTNSNSISSPAIKRATYTCNLNGGSLTGDMRLIKQGDGILSMASATHTYTGETDVWGGTLNFDGTLSSSPVTLRRHTTLNTSGGSFPGGITMEYGATLNVGGATTGTIGTVDVGTLTLGYGAMVMLDINSTDDHDCLNATTLVVDDAKVGDDAWENYGPEYIAPVVHLNFGQTPENGVYPIGNVENVAGDLSKVVVEANGLTASMTLQHEDGILYVEIADVSVIMANEPVISVTDMEGFDFSSDYPLLHGSKNSYLPVVSIEHTLTDGITPVLSGTFTSLDGTVSNLGSEKATVIMSEDYESATDASDWTLGCSGSLISGDETYGSYIKIASEGSSGNRRSYKTFFTTGTDFYGETASYTVEFDALFHHTNQSGNYNELVLFGEGASMPAVNGYFNSVGNNYLFRLTGGSYYSTDYTVENTSETATIGDSWCHYVVTIDRETRNVSYVVTKGSETVLEGSYTANDEANMEVQGIGITMGRAYSYAYIDNIEVKEKAVDLSTYAFTEPGTLSVTATIDGNSDYVPSTATFVVEMPYKMIYDSPDYNTIAATDATSALGSDWYTNDDTSVDARGWNRFANWAKITYAFAINSVNSSSETMYVDQDEVVWVDYTGSQTALHLVEGYGLGQSGGSTFHAANLGDERTLIYHRYDFSLGNSVNLMEEYVHADADGSYSYGSTSATLQKFTAYVPLETLWGDINHDGAVSISDVTQLVNRLLGKDNGSVVEVEADLNEDGNVSIADVTALVNFILGK
ncbi:MAG: hypothetical protein K6C10_07745 [Prevotella sp.]|nr:hypothetical protein [Prevotella sp.]